MEAPALFFSSIIPTSIYRAIEIGIADDCQAASAGRVPTAVRRATHGIRA
ncbi:MULTISPECIES: hypothetical protein [Burkholderia]|nr:MULTISPECIES: hypothetical protein [Burkholderia]